MIIKTLSLGIMQTNCYILYNSSTKDAVVFDPACCFDAIRECIDELNLRIKYIIITHAHFDHIDALDELKNYTGAPICIGNNDNNGLSDPALNLCSAFGGVSPSSKADRLLYDGDVLDFPGSPLKIISTPGHTTGGICILCGDVLISGDTLFYESVGRSDFPGGNAQTLINSIKTKLFVLPDNTNVYPGHGPSTTIAHEKTNNPFIW